MTIPQLMAVLAEYDRLQAEEAIQSSDAVFAGVAPAFNGKDGARASKWWRNEMEASI